MGEFDFQIPQLSKRRILVHSLLLLIPVALLFLFVIGFYHRQELAEDRRLLSLRQTDHMHLVETAIKKDLKVVTVDLHYLQSIIAKELPSGETPSVELLEWFENIFFEFSRSKKNYDQIRWLDQAGKERVRVNYRNGKAVVIPEDQLQNKAHRYYFSDSLDLGKGQLFVSPFDLNREHKIVEKPERPMIRFGMRVIDLAGASRGVILINYNGSEIIDYMQSRDEGSLGSQILANQNGYYLHHPIARKCWGFMYENRAAETLKIDRPKLWKRIKSGEKTNQFFDENGFTLFHSILPVEDCNSDRQWILISHISPEDLHLAMHHDMRIHVISFVIVLVLSAGILFLWALAREKGRCEHEAVVRFTQLHKKLSEEQQESKS